MNRFTIFILIIYSILLFTGTAAAQDAASERLTVPLSFPGKTGKLTVKHVKGSIRVSGYDGSAVVIGASVRNGGSTEKVKVTSNGMKRITSPAFQLSAEEDNNNVTVITDSHIKTIDLEIIVPRHFNMNLETYHNGIIDISDVSGEIEASNANGEITISNLAGSVLLSTIDGNITVAFSTMTPGIPMAVSSVYGNIDITLPKDARANLKMKTDLGDIFCDFDIAIEKRKSKIDTGNESVKKITLEEWKYAKMNGGGQEVLLKSFNGNIYLRHK